MVIEWNGHKRRLRKIVRGWQLYTFLLPALIYYIVFHYAPMYGIQIAFRDYTARGGIMGSKWVGFKHFFQFFALPQFGILMKNTILLSLMALAIGFPLPIVFALMLNEVQKVRFRKVVQNLTYAPHFISTVVLVGMVTAFLSPSSGIINKLMVNLGGEKRDYMARAEYFRWIYCISGIWQNLGWGSILYLSALSGIAMELHEAAQIDGATRLQRIWHVNLPGIMPTIIITLILNVGNILNIGFEKVYLMQNSLNLESSEIISTYVYKMGLQKAQFSFSSAVGLFNAVINFSLLTLVNSLSKRLTETSLW